MNSQELMANLTEELSEIPHISEPQLEAKWIIERALGDDMGLFNQTDLKLDSSQKEFLDRAVQERSEGVPLAYILGEREFYSLSFAVNPGVLIPRPESEHLVDGALSWLKDHPHIESPRILDLGAGSGCIGLSILKNCPKAFLCSVDSSVEALDVVDFNAKSLDLSRSIQLLCMSVESLSEEDMPERFRRKVDVVVANPPYIKLGDHQVEKNVELFEPSEALFADEDGLGAIRRWSKQVPRFLADEGVVFFEIGSDQRQSALEVFQDLGSFNKIEVLKDYSGHDRLIRAER